MTWSSTSPWRPRPSWTSRQEELLRAAGRAARRGDPAGPVRARASRASSPGCGTRSTAADGAAPRSGAEGLGDRRHRGSRRSRRGVAPRDTGPGVPGRPGRAGPRPGRAVRGGGPARGRRPPAAPRRAGGPDRRRRASWPSAWSPAARPRRAGTRGAGPRGRARRAEPALVVVQAIPKGDRGELAVELMTEVGVDVIVPGRRERCVGAGAGSGATGRWAAGGPPPGRRASRPAAAGSPR